MDVLVRLTFCGNTFGLTRFANQPLSPASNKAGHVHMEMRAARRTLILGGASFGLSAGVAPAQRADKPHVDSEVGGADVRFRVST